MKKITLLFSLCLLCFTVYAQQSSITVHINAGELKDSLSHEQMQQVTELTVTGSMNDSDFYLIRDSISNLKVLNLKEVNVDTIPEKAFYHFKCKNIYLPNQSLYIHTSAFESEYISELIVTGPFPILGNNVFGYERRYGTFIPCEDNDFCKMEDGSIYSVNGLIYYFFNDNYYYTPNINEGVEIIESHAFEYVPIQEICIPSSVKLIKEYAFYDVIPLIPNFICRRSNCYLYSKAEVPP